jgi:hypothetical protein
MQFAQGLKVKAVPGQEAVATQTFLQFIQNTLSLLQVNTLQVLPSQLP